MLWKQRTNYSCSTFQPESPVHLSLIREAANFKLKHGRKKEAISDLEELWKWVGWLLKRDSLPVDLCKLSGIRWHLTMLVCHQPFFRILLYTGCCSEPYFWRGCHLIHRWHSLENLVDLSWRPVACSEGYFNDWDMLFSSLRKPWISKFHFYYLPGGIWGVWGVY